MILKHVRRFLPARRPDIRDDARLADRSADPADRRDEQIVDDGIITSNDGRYIDAVLDGQTVCIGGTSPRTRAHVEIGLPAAVLDLPARLAALADQLDEHARLSRPVSPPKEKSPWLSTPDADTSQHGYCDGLVEAAGRLRRLLAADTPPTPARPEDDGEGDQEVWLPPIGDALAFHADEPCPHCSSVAHHLRTGRCGDCGRRPHGSDPADTATVGDARGLAITPNPELLAPEEQEAIDSGHDRPQATWIPALGWRGPLIEDTCKAGDPDPTVYTFERCCSARRPTGTAFRCTRDPGHSGQHVAGTGGCVAAVWPQDGER